jgi:hypothetical protein
MNPTRARRKLPCERRGVARQGSVTSKCGKRTLFRSDEWDLPDSAVAVRYFDPPPFPAAHVVPLQVMNDLEGFRPGRRVVGQKLRCFEAIKSAAVAEGKAVERHP